MTTTTRSRRRQFQPTLDALPARLSPSSLNPLLPVTREPDPPVPPVFISPMEPTLTDNLVSTQP